MDDLERRLDNSKASLLKHYANRIDAVERLRPAFVIVGVIGAFAAALSRFDTGAIGLSVAIVGAAMALMGGAAVAVLDFRKLELGQEAREAHTVADEAMAARAASERRLGDIEKSAKRLDQKRRERLLAIEQMTEVMEAALLHGADADATAERLLKRSIAAIRKAIDYEAVDFLTVSIFRRSAEHDGEKMRRIAAQWTDPERAGMDGRDWQVGKGYTGVAWANALTNPRGDVIEGDTTLPHIRAQYPVDTPDSAREALYRSVAAIPILVGGTNEVWGVVTATSDRIGVFRRDQSNLVVQNVDMIRDVARIAALLAGLKSPSGRKPRRSWLGN